MPERETERARETEVKEPGVYERVYRLYQQMRERANTGLVVIRGKDRPWEQNRQAYQKTFLNPVVTDTALQGWMFFVQDIRTHSGRHKHQGGLAIYVIKGRGWTVVDGVKYEWEEEDLLLLPVKPGGCEHQHFNAEPGKACLWLAMVYTPYLDAMGNELNQTQASPDWSHA